MKHILRFSLNIVVLLIGFYNTMAQNYMINDDCFVSVPIGSKININGTLINQNTGIFVNQDSIYISGNIIQSASNNLFQMPVQGTVLLVGANQQIWGTTTPYFNNLNLQGVGVKSLGEDVRIKGSLDLNDRELSTGNNTLFIDNTDTLAIKRTSGFISSGYTGFLQRSMANKGKYLFPTGWTAYSANYRPLIIKTSTPNADTFRVRLTGYNATTDGFDINNKEIMLCKVNDLFYHHISRLAGNGSHVDLTFYFDSLNDGGFDKVAHWHVVPQWQNTASPGSLVYLTSPQLSSITINKWSSFNPAPFALAISNPDAAITYVHPICVDNTVQTFTANTPGGTWSGTGITDPVNGVFDPQISGPGIFTIYYSVTSANGCSNTDSSTVTVVASSIPSFTANITGQDVNFTNNSLNAISYFWDFGDGNTSVVKSPIHTYTTIGTYTVILYATNACGTVSTYQTVNITTVGLIENSILDNNVSLYPNPFKNETILTFTLNTTSIVFAELYGIKGEKIASLIEERKLTEGTYFININSLRLNNLPGVYILRICINDQTVMKRIIKI